MQIKEIFQALPMKRLVERVFTPEKRRSHCRDFSGDRFFNKPGSYEGTENYCYARLAVINLPIL
ncbi:hypothetical protein [Nostoc sp.]|uniref:hypothetical protein n=1 Tax=Nostoc sp. TaxID=1180 RepID=UPI002FFA6ADF